MSMALTFPQAPNDYDDLCSFMPFLSFFSWSDKDNWAKRDMFKLGETIDEFSSLIFGLHPQRKLNEWASKNGYIFQ